MKDARARAPMKLPEELHIKLSPEARELALWGGFQGIHEVTAQLNGQGYASRTPFYRRSRVSLIPLTATMSLLRTENIEFREVQRVI